MAVILKVVIDTEKVSAAAAVVVKVVTLHEEMVVVVVIVEVVVVLPSILILIMLEHKQGKFHKTMHLTARSVTCLFTVNQSRLRNFLRRTVPLKSLSNHCGKQKPRRSIHISIGKTNIRIIAETKREKRKHNILPKTKCIVLIYRTIFFSKCMKK